MSQIFKPLTSGGPIPPTIPTQFNTQDGNATPSGNILIVNGVDSIENNNNGIITKGGVAGTGTINEVDIVITNRLQGSTTTIGATTSPFITFIPTDIGTYAIECRIAAYNSTSLLGSGYSLFGSIRFDGVNSNLCGTPDKIENEEGAMISANTTMTVAGASVSINGVGYVGQTIDWSAVALYTYVG